MFVVRKSWGWLSLKRGDRLSELRRVEKRLYDVRMLEKKCVKLRGELVNKCLKLISEIEVY